MGNYNLYEKKVFDLKQLLEISRALNSTLDYYYLIEAVLDMCLAHAQTIKAGLFLTPDMDSEILLPVNSTKTLEMPSKHIIQKISTDAPFVRYLEDKKPHLNINEMLKLFPETEHTILFQRMEVELLIGIITRGKVVGVIFLGEKITREHYSEEECSFLVDLASLSGIAVTNARLYERATIDQMTGLKNHAYFQSKLREERDKAKKRNSTLAILFTDVDHFKKFNDTHGHQAGDLVLKAVANVINRSIRKSDIAARYGGEEFCVIMPGSNQKSAMEAAERIRSGIEKIKLEYQNKKLEITTSVGVAFFDANVDAKKNSLLIERADKALYVCKKSGRNKVILYNDSME